MSSMGLLALLEIRELLWLTDSAAQAECEYMCIEVIHTTDDIYIQNMKIYTSKSFISQIYIYIQNMKIYTSKSFIPQMIYTFKIRKYVHLSYSYHRQYVYVCTYISRICLMVQKTNSTAACISKRVGPPVAEFME